MWLQNHGGAALGLHAPTQITRNFPLTISHVSVSDSLHEVSVHAGLNRSFGTTLLLLVHLTWPMPTFPLGHSIVGNVMIVISRASGGVL